MAIIYTAIHYLLEFIQYAILARVIISWLPIPHDNMLVRIIYQITEPILGPIRAMISRSAMGRNSMLDFSPIVAFLLIYVISSIVDRLAMSGSMLGI